LLKGTVVVTRGARTTGVAAVNAVVADITETESVVAITMMRAVVDTVEEVVVPHVPQYCLHVRVCEGFGLVLQVRHTSVHEDLVRVVHKHGAVGVPRQGFDVLQARRQVGAAIGTVATAVPAGALRARLCDENGGIGATKGSIQHLLDKYNNQSAILTNQ
jgi:hypothetical protein